MNSKLLSYLLLLCFFSCKSSIQESEVKKKYEVQCTFEKINLEYDLAYCNDSILRSIFDLTNHESLQLRQLNKIKSNRVLREMIMQKFVSRLCDSLSFRENCTVLDINNSAFSYKVNQTIGDFSLYCLARIEPFPLALATGYQNCTEPWISNDVPLPINFTLFGDYNCDYVFKRYNTYFKSKRREYYIEKYGYI